MSNHNEILTGLVVTCVCMAILTVTCLIRFVYRFMEFGGNFRNDREWELGSAFALSLVQLLVAATGMFGIAYALSDFVA